MAANAQVCQALGPEQQEAVRKAAALARQFLAFKSTAAIRQHLVGLAKEHGFLGMLARTTEPFQHGGFACSVLQGPPCCDLEFINTTGQGLAQLLQGFVGAIRSNNEKIYGAERLAAPTERPTLLQAVVDLLCHDPDAVKLAAASPHARAHAHQGAAAAAFMDMAAAATALASATVRGDDEGAARAAAAVQEAVAGALALQHDAAGPAAAGGQQGVEQGEQLEQAHAEQAKLHAPHPSRDLQQAVLQAGSGVVLLVTRGDRAKVLPKGTVGGGMYSHYTVVQLMECLVLAGSLQSISCRVAAEFLTGVEPRTGNWSKKAFNLKVEPSAMVLLSSQARHKLGKQFRGDGEGAKGYRTLYPSFTDTAA